MNKKDIIIIFLKEGILLSPEETNSINEENYKEILENKTKEIPKKQETKKTIKQTKNKEVKKENVSVTSSDFVKSYKKRYDMLKEMLLKKIDAVSIDKGKRVFSEVNIVGRVKETNGSFFVLEDITGETEIMHNSNEVSVGDVLGVSGNFRESKFNPKQIIWPDVPLEKTPQPLNHKIILTTVKKESDDITVYASIRQGEMLTEKYNDNIFVTSYFPTIKISEEDAVKIMKRRMIPEKFSLNVIVDKIPHILWIMNNDNNWTKNYKGVVIISSDENSYVVYDGKEAVFERI